MRVYNQSFIRVAAFAIFSVLVFASVCELRLGRAAQRGYAVRRALAHSLTSDLRRASEYGATEMRLFDLRGGSIGPIIEPALPVGIAPPVREVKRMTPVGGWRAIRLDLKWDYILTGQAMAVLSSLSACRVIGWNLVSLDLVASPDGKTAALSVTLESAESCAESAE